MDSHQIYHPGTSGSVNPPSSSTGSNFAGGGGGTTIPKDNCPDGDTSFSYYDGKCTPTKPLVTTPADPIEYQDEELYNTTIENGYCYTRRDHVSILDSKVLKTSEEFKRALSFLYSYEMTMYRAVDEFEPRSKLTREQAAKIFSNFAINVLCRKPDPSLLIEYTDTDNSNPTLKPYILTSFQLGLMKGKDKEFRPKDAITKAEFNAVLIRMIIQAYLPEDTGETRYDEYNKASAQLGIIKQGAANRSVIRNDAALMLFRAYKNQVFTKYNGSFVIQNRAEFIR